MQVLPSQSLQYLRRNLFSSASTWHSPSPDTWQRRAVGASTSRRSQSSPRQSDKVPGDERSPPSSQVKPAQPSQEHSTATLTGSLLAELFPKEVNRSNVSVKTARKIRQLPIRPSDTDFTNQEKPNELTELVTGSSTETEVIDPHVVTLKRAGKNLLEEDFQKLVPGDAHLEGWNAAEVLTKVIRGRDANTLEPNGNYYILFRTAAAAKMYIAHIRQIHISAQLYSPASDNLAAPIAYSSPIQLPYLGISHAPKHVRDGAVDGEVDQEIEHASKIQAEQSSQVMGYALVPPSARIEISLEQRPYRPFLYQLIKQGGYGKIVADRGSDYEVLLSVEGGQPTLRSLRYAIIEDGKRRNMRWNIVGASKGVREINLSHSASAEYDAEDPERIEGKDMSGYDQQRRRHDFRKKWIVSFRSSNEAKRFVSVWHRRSLESLLPRTRSTSDDVVNAEIIM